jgi:hypothetical protein
MGRDGRSENVKLRFVEELKLMSLMRSGGKEVME